MAPSTEFPGNLFYALTFFGFLTFFVYSVGVRFRWFLRGQWVDRFTRPVERAIGLIPWLMVTDVFTHSFDIYLVEGENEGLSFLAYGVAQIWDGAGMSVGTAE